MSVNASVCYSVSGDECVNILSSHQVIHTLQCQVRYAAVILVAAVPERQLAREERPGKETTY